MATAGIIEAIQRVRDEARRRGVRWTSQRQAIVDTFLASKGHLSVEDLHKLVRASDPTVSAATVYRTVNLLVELGVAHKRHFGGSSAAFESALDREHHDHLVCLGCGQITEFNHAPIEEMQVAVAQLHGFTLLHHRMDLYGLCAACRERGVQPGPTPDRS